MNFARRIVIDTGVLVSAAIRPRSVPSLAVKTALLRFDPCVSDETWAELQDVLARPKFDRYVPRPMRQTFLQELQNSLSRITVAEIVTDCPDPKDNKFLALAAAAEAELILASDAHLTDMNPWRGIAIVRPAEFLACYR